MKKYALKCAALVLAVVLPYALWIGYILAIPDHLGGNIAATANYKAELMKNTASPRVIFAGGSSSPYGMVCQTVSDVLEVNAINVGVTAYLGLDYYLSLLDAYAQPGDVIVLAPEQMLLKYDCTNYELMWTAAAAHPAVWRAMPLHYLPGMFCATRAYYSLKKSQLSFERAESNEAFGPLGDVTLERTSLLESGYNRQDPVTLYSYEVSAEILEKINRLAAKLERRGATLLFAFAPIDELAITTSAEDAAAFEAAVTDGLDIPVILPLGQAIMEGKYFYDSNNHLTSEGAVLNTQNLIEGLRPYVGAE